MKRILLIAFLGLISIQLYSQVWLNRSVVDGRVDSVWSGYGLPQGFNGDGVIIGVTDWGFDYTHPVFYDTNMIRYRVLRAWDQFKTSGPAPDGYDYGTEYIGPEALLTAHCDTFNAYSYGYHGTHCASIAAGGGAGSKYRGVAHEANLLFCSFYLEDPHYVIDAWRWMYNVAQQEGKRLVISMSWGVYYMDNMDGTGMVADEIRRLTDLGVLFVTSAGNNGDSPFHIKHLFDQPGDTIHSQFLFPYNNGYLWGSSITMMNSANSPFAFSFTVMNSSLQPVAEIPFINTAGNDGYVDTFLVVGNDTIVYNYDIQSCNSYNQSPIVRLRVMKNSNYRFALAATADTGTFHAWNVAELTKAYGNWGGDFVKPEAYPDWLAGDIEYGISTPGNVDEVITVAAHNARVKTSIGVWSGGALADFSSSGPCFHDVMKPDLSAPGQNVVSAISSYTNTFSGNYSRTFTFNGRTYHFAALSGTSMSCPFVAGVAALMLQANPYLSPGQIQDILNETAYNDEFTAEFGPIRFGHGKVDAYAAILKALNTVGVQDYVSTPESSYTLFPNPTSDDYCYLTVQSDMPSIQCTLHDMMGRILYRETVTPGVNTLNLHGLPSGCYILRLNDGQKVTTKKLVKNN
ncbi:MAG: S8 family peptidase [Bacteroidales bacterium]|nr:S8 family peptidase [Bacteroidales bacterium]